MLENAFQAKSRVSRCSRELFSFFFSWISLKISPSGARADPCVYTCTNESVIAIITIWVDDLLHFADSAESMDTMKNDICTEWETMNMGEPTKIVSIKITQSPGWISITQKKSIQNIFERQGLANVSPI
jgi:hypothetical protein